MPIDYQLFRREPAPTNLKTSKRSKPAKTLKTRDASKMKSKSEKNITTQLDKMIERLYNLNEKRFIVPGIMNSFKMDTKGSDIPVDSFFSDIGNDLRIPSSMSKGFFDEETKSDIDRYLPYYSNILTNGNSILTIDNKTPADSSSRRPRRRSRKKGSKELTSSNDSLLIKSNQSGAENGSVELSEVSQIRGHKKKRRNKKRSEMVEK